MDHATPSLHDPRHLGEQLQTRNPFGARFSTSSLPLYSNPSQPIGRNPPKQQILPSHPFGSPFSNSSLAIYTQNQNRHGVHANEDQNDGGYNRKAALNLNCDYYNKHDPFGASLDEDWKGISRIKQLM